VASPCPRKNYHQYLSAKPVQNKGGTMTYRWYIKGKKPYEDVGLSVVKTKR